MRQKSSLYILLRLFLLLFLLNLNLISVISFSTTAAAAAIAVPFSDFQYAQHYPSSTEDQTQIWETNLSFFQSGNNDDLLFQQQQQQAPSVLKNNGHAILEEVPFEINNIDIPTLLAGQNGGGGAGGAQGGFDCKGQESLCCFGNNYYPNDQTRPFKGTCADANGWITNAGFFPGSGPDGQYCSNLKYYHDCASALATAQSKECYSDCAGTGIQGDVQRKES